jgi:hypothetical protein
MSNRIILPFISIVLLLSMFLTGCRNYKSFSLTEGIGHFSFEYSPRFTQETLRTEGVNRAETHVLLETAVEYYPHISAEVVIHIEMAGDRYRNSSELLDLFISDFDRDYDGCKLVKRSEKYIHGIQGEELIYSFDEYNMDSIPPGSHIVSTPATTKIMAFDHDGLIWYILLTSHESYLSQAESDFDHILETFNILE